MAQPHKDHDVVDLMSRRGVMGLGATAAALGLGACGDADPDVVSAPPGSDTDLSGSLVLWAYPMDQDNDTEWYQQHIDSFREKFPGIDVEVVMQPWEGREEQLTASITGGNAPDVVYMTPDFLPRFADEDLLVSLDELRDWSTFTSASREPLTYDGSLYAAPVLIQAAQTFANKRLLNELGVEGPTTWDEMRTVGEIAAEAGYYLTQYSGDETLNQNYYMYLWQAGGDVLTEDGSAAAFNSAEGLEALEFIKEMNDKGWLPTEPLSVIVPFEQTDLAQGNVVYSQGYMLSTARSIISDELEILAPMKHREQVAIGSPGGMSIFNTTESPEAAAALVHHLSEPEFIESMAVDFSYYSPRSDLTGIHEDDEQVAEFEQYIEFVDKEVIHPQSREIMDTLKPTIQEVLLQGLDPKEALDKMESAVNELISRGR